MERIAINWLRRRSRWRRPRRWVGRRSSWFLLVGLVSAIEVVYIPHRGCYPVAFYLDLLGRGAARVRWSRPEYTVKRKNLRAEASVDGPCHLAAVETDVLGKLPNIVSHCCVMRYDDGSARKPGWITLKTMGAAWVVQVKDPDGCCQMMLTAATLDDALALADVMLGAEDAPWEPDPFLRRAESQKKK